MQLLFLKTVCFTIMV